MDWTVLSITASLIAVLAYCKVIYKQWKHSQEVRPQDMYVKRERDDSDITNLIPHAMREKGRKRATWKYE